MAVQIRFLGRVATFDGQWTCEDEVWRLMLEALTRDSNYSPAMGRPDVYVARTIVERLGHQAEVIWVSPDTMPPDTVY